MKKPIKVYVTFILIIKAIKKRFKNKFFIFNFHFNY